MTQRFLTPVREKFEISGALFFAGFSLWIMFLTPTADVPPLAWMRISEAAQMTVGYVFATGALLHGAGVWINGRRWWSPMLRVLGMMVHSGALSWLAFNTPNPASTAVYVYAVFGVVMALGTINALEDCFACIRRDRNGFADG